MKKIGIAVLVALVASAPARAELRPGTFASASLGRDVGYVVDLPGSYATGDKRYPVVYALHGLFESSAFWQRRGLADALQALRDKSEVPDFIVVTVDGGNSFFVNAPSAAFEDLVTKDLIAHVEASFRAMSAREARAVFGVSMGGYGALRIAFKRPDLFAAAATHSAMLLEKLPTAEDGARRGQMAAFNRIFGSPIDPAMWTANDPLALAEKLDPKTAPALYFDCGSEDRYLLYLGNKELHEKLTARGVKHEFALSPGDHGYEYVRGVIAKSLRFLGGVFQNAPARPAAPTAKAKKD
jgi:enterochelin esterase family protein